MSVTASMVAYGLVAVGVGSGLAAWWGYERGYDQGKLVVQAERNAQQVQDLTGQLRAVAADVAASARDSAAARAQLNTIQKSQAASTKDLKHALEKNSTNPVLCRFDADSMRILAAARAAAADAAASGIRGAVPAAR